MPSTTQDNAPAPVRTDTESKAWAALHAHPESTTAEIAQHAKIGRSTAGKILAAWSNSGDITRIPGIKDGARRFPDRFAPATAPEPDTPTRANTPAEADAASDPDEPETNRTDATPSSCAHTTAPIGDGEGSETPVASDKRLAKGELRGMVEDYLTAHPGAEFSPGQIAKALDRSAGAVNNALHKLADEGYAHQTQTSPKRFAASSEEP
ncbi:MarR family transcriptional regulator [Saccharopolyspora endophytica]|uniref:MarR family transcriptional regulator n=1 Tax=Saccharopolyspora endophytica TaxID=543886 RepID=A0ABS5D9X5_9PSEU|nr:MarR family transcriptional regulator [Saccharopolyspora endophytica]MBQ0923069.1 MarR family transcriptional regulator [Saccharopolyspora endophytica]